jgi:aminoglycoside 2'-N-acetyltransferase I
MTPLVIDVISHDRLTVQDVARLRALFDAEYHAHFGAWDPDQPYGYAPHDVHIIARRGASVVGHVGWERRVIGVGTADVTVAGVGGVLISPRARGDRVGARLMVRATESMAAAGDVRFGYLGCREEVVPFYESCGWHRIAAVERSIGRTGASVEQPVGPPILTLPLDEHGPAWPSGTIDLRGRAW